jgi:gluconate 5-dehydrogenase/7-alpha-hydroxysteroid dehydrogenase
MTQSDPLARFRLDGRAAIVTGIGPGIGEHVAKAFASVGANVVCAARRADNVERVAAEIRAAGGQAIAVPTDVGRAEDLERLVGEARAAFGPIEIVFNNAYTGSVAGDTDPLAVDDQLWQDAIAVNLLAPHRLAEHVVPDMRAIGRGSIINLLTCAAFTPIGPQLVYGSTKAATHMMTRYLAKICGPDIRVNAICPGSITPDGADREVFTPLIAKNAITRVGHADEAVGAALFLASDASSYTTGSVVFVEGGRVGTIS